MYNNLNPFVWLILEIIDIYKGILTAWFVFSLLVAIGVLNRYLPIVQRISYILHQLTDPVLNPIRKYMPDLGGVDISPIVLILGMNFVIRLIFQYAV